MFITEASAVTSVDPEAIWALWSDPDGWSTWDPDVEAVEFDGSFVDGATGVIVPAAGPRIRWTLEDVRPGVSFTTAAKVPGSVVKFHHVIAELGGQRTVTHSVEMMGWSTPLLGRVLGPRLAPNLATAVNNVAAAHASLES